MKKTMAILLSALMVAGAATGCGAKSDGADQGSGKKGEKVTLTTVSMMGGTDANTGNYKAVVEQFMKDHPNVTIEDTSQVADQTWKAKIAAQFSVGDEPDVIQFFTDTNAAAVLQSDKFVTLEEIQKEYPDYAKDTLPNALETTKNPDGVNRAVPTTGYWEGLFCNKDMFEKYNLELPTSWDKFEKAIKTFKENNIVPISCSLNEVPHYWVEWLMLAEAGPEAYTQIPTNEDGSLSTEAPEGWVKGLDMIKTLYDMGAFSEDAQTITNDAAGELFKTKKAAMQLDGSWFAGGIDDQENTVVVALPNTKNGLKDDKDIIGGLSSGFYITKKAWNDPSKRDLAVQFVMANTSKEQIETYWNGNGIATVEIETPADMSNLGKSGIELSKTMHSSYTPTDSRIAEAAYTAITTSIVDLVNGSQTAKEIIENALVINKEAAGE